MDVPDGSDREELVELLAIQVHELDEWLKSHGPDSQVQAERDEYARRLQELRGDTA